MGPPGGGRSNITGRCVRHFNVLAYPELDKDIISQIFTKLTKNFYKRYATNIQAIVPQLVDSVLEVYYLVRRDLLPTPSKSHYTFNLRDIYRVCMGLCSSTPKYCNDLPVLAKLWFNENMRVFHDRLTTEQDRDYLKNTLGSFIEKLFQLKKEEALDIERIIWADFLAGREADPRIYAPVTDIGLFIGKMDAF